MNSPPDASSVSLKLRDALVQYFALSADKVCEILQTSDKGLSPTEAAERLKTLGPNSLDARTRSPTLTAVLTQLRNPLAWLLMFAATVSGIMREWTDTVVIAGILLFGSVIFSAQESSRDEPPLRTR